jgi:hypothetical protein
MLDFIEQVGSPNLLLAVNIGHLLMREDDLGETLAQCSQRMGFILISAPEFDIFGKAYDTHGCVHASEVDLSPLRQFRHIPQVLDADYPSLDDEYLDCIAAWHSSANGRQR